MPVRDSLFFAHRLGCPENVCDCKYGYTIAGVSLSVGACTFPGVDQLPKAINEARSTLATLVSQISTYVTHWLCHSCLDRVEAKLKAATQVLTDNLAIVESLTKGGLNTAIKELKTWADTVGKFFTSDVPEYVKVACLL
jgi:hypothetical protein